MSRMLRPSRDSGGVKRARRSSRNYDTVTMTRARRRGGGEGREERQVGKGKPRNKRFVVEAADGCHRCNGNFQWLRGGVEIGAGGDSEWKEKEKKSERASERANEGDRRREPARRRRPIPLSVETGRDVEICRAERPR